MATGTLTKVVGVTLGVLLLNGSAARSEPNIPVQNESGRFMRLIAIIPGGRTVTLDLNKDEKKNFDISTAGIYELKVEDADHRVALIGKYDLRELLAKDPKTRIFLQSKYTTPAKGRTYDGPTGSVGPGIRLRK